MTQFFQQLLTVSAVLQNEVGENDVETVGLDLANHLGTVAGAMDCRNAQGRKHHPQRLPSRGMTVDDKHALLGQRLLKHQQHLFVV